MNCKNLFCRCIYISIVCLFLFCSNKAKSQISDGGIPASFNEQSALKNQLPVVQIPVNFSVEDMKVVDAWQVSQGAPLAVATLIDTDLSMDNAGHWLTLSEGKKIWQLHLQAKGAIALMLYYETFYIPEGGKLFIYNADKTHLLGAYTARTNPAGKSFATEFVAGDNITLEYEPSLSGEQACIKINQVGYGYNYLSVSSGLKSTGPGTSGSCMVNINCEEGEEWQNEKNGVCQMAQKIGKTTYLCTGSLINNTAKDMKPYILSAFHCSQDTKNNIIASDDDLNQWIFHFHFEHSGCENSSPVTEHKSMVGCTRKVSIPMDGGSDGLLVLLNSDIPKDYNVYFNGWDRSETPASSGVNIHHPSADYMKISTFVNYPVETVTWLDETYTEGANNAHWNVIFDKTQNGHGITAGGSSGSPLFNQNKLITGTLTGGNSTCRYTDGRNIYGKLSYHWNKHDKSDNGRMDIWLDPLNTGAVNLAGLSQTGEEGTLIDYKSPTDVTAKNVSSKNVLIEWNPPLYKQIIGWGTQSSSKQISYSNTPFYFGQRWDTKDLKELHKKSLTAINFIPASNAFYAIYIKQGERIYRQEISNTEANKSNSIQLKIPFTIDAGQELIVSIYARKYSRSAPAFMDGGPAINGKGNLISFDGKKWEYLQNEETDNNFILSAVVTSTEGTLTRSTAFPVVTGYNIYKNRQKLASVSASTLQYTDRNVTPGTHNYSVSALYDTNESKQAAASVEIKVDSERLLEIDEVYITPTIFKDQLQIMNHQHVKYLEIYTVDGKMIRKINAPSKQINLITIPQGVYFIRLLTDKTTKTIRCIKQ